jgi:T-box protein 20
MHILICLYRDPMEGLFLEQHFLRSPLRLYSELDVDNNNQLYHPALSQASMDKRLQLQLWGAATAAAAAAAAAASSSSPHLAPSSCPSSPPSATSSPRTSSAPSATPSTPAELHAFLAAAAASGPNGHRGPAMPPLPPHLWAQWPPIHAAPSGPPTHPHLHALNLGADLRLPRPVFPMHQRYSPYLIPPKSNSMPPSTPPSVQIPSAGHSPTPDSTPSPRD